MRLHGVEVARRGRVVDARELGELAHVRRHAGCRAKGSRSRRSRIAPFQMATETSLGVVPFLPSRALRNFSPIAAAVLSDEHRSLTNAALEFAVNGVLDSARLDGHGFAPPNARLPPFRPAARIYPTPREPARELQGPALALLLGC